MTNIRTIGPAKARKTSRVNFFTLYLQPGKIHVQVTNFNFTPEEASAISERNFFLLKNSATQKVIALFGELEKEIKKDLNHRPVNGMGNKSLGGKIFRGENYRLFPYIVLDYPRQFSTESIFAFRTMFWWGHEFSFTLHLQGNALDHFRKAIIMNRHLLLEKEIFFCVNESPWEYHFGNENYLHMEEISEERMMQNTSFIKLSKKLPVEKHNEIISVGVETFSLFMKILK